MEIMSASTPENLWEGGSTSDLSVCSSVVQSALGLLLMEARPKQFGPTCFATNLVQQTPLCFYPNFIDKQGTREGRVGERPRFDTDRTNLAERDIVPWLKLFVNKKSPILPPHSNLLRKHPPFFKNKTMGLAAWIITGNIWLKKEFQKGLQILSFHEEERVLTQIIVRPGISGLAGVINRRLIHFDVL